MESRFSASVRNSSSTLRPQEALHLAKQIARDGRAKVPKREGEPFVEIRVEEAGEF